METVIERKVKIEDKKLFDAEIDKGMRIINDALKKHNINSPKDHVALMWDMDINRLAIAFSYQYWPSFSK